LLLLGILTSVFLHRNRFFRISFSYEPFQLINILYTWSFLYSNAYCFSITLAQEITSYLLFHSPIVTMKPVNFIVATYEVLEKNSLYFIFGELFLRDLQFGTPKRYRKLSPALVLTPIPYYLLTNFEVYNFLNWTITKILKNI